MIPAHEVVRRTYPRPPAEEKDEIAMAIGRAIDGALARFAHEAREGRRPTATAMLREAEAIRDEALSDAGITLSGEALGVTQEEFRSVIRLFRQSPLFGLRRPRTRVVVIGGDVGVYAQPDFWDERTRFYEMKSYRAIPPSAEVALQLALFQLAFPTLEAVLYCLDRHARPIAASSAVVPAPTEEERSATLRTADSVGRTHGVEKVFEYVEGPFVHYPRPPPVAAPRP